MDLRALLARYKAALITANNGIDDRDACLNDINRAEKALENIK